MKLKLLVTCKHAARTVNSWIQRFEGRVVALHHEIEWPPRSPDLTPLDFFLWGYLKQNVFGIKEKNRRGNKRITQ